MARSDDVLDVKLAIDHPFLFLIRDVNSGAILFTAQVTDPTSGPSASP
jgi:serine protease inhibitor